jgi:hypothetical protein
VTNILTAAEAANFLRTDATDAALLMLLPLVDDYVERATGRDWTADSPILDLAKAAAGIIITSWYDDPAQVGGTPARANGVLAQLEAEALKYRKHTVYGLDGTGGIYIADARVGDEVVSVTGIYGVSGDQSANFESAVSVDYALQQSSSADLSDNLYVVILKHPAEDIVP